MPDALRLSNVQLEVLASTPIEARKTPPNRRWSFWLRDRAVTQSVNVLLRLGFLTVRPVAERRAAAVLTTKGQEFVRLHLAPMRD